MDIANGVLTMNVEAGEVGFVNHSGLKFHDFVLQVDSDLHGLGEFGAAEFGWRRAQGYAVYFSLSRSGKCRSVMRERLPEY